MGSGGVTSILPTPTLSTPMSGDTLAAQDTALVWHAAQGATLYEVQIGPDSLFSSIVVDSTVIGDTTIGMQGAVNSKLSSNTKYFWRVKALSSGAMSSFSAVWSFITSTITSINDREIPKEYQLRQNYPNPFNPTTVISYGLPKNTFVTLGIYDELGREVKLLVNEWENAGDHSVNFDASSLPSGAYFYHFKAGSYTATKKLLLLK